MRATEGQYLGHNWHIHFRIIKGICEGLKYLHDVSIMHFDLKPDNILLDGNMVPKIADFGLSRLVGEQNTIMTMSPLGTLGFLPPELINKQVISKEYDIFSLGAIIKRIVTGAMDKESIPDMDQPEYVELVYSYWKEKLQEIPTQSFEAACKQVKTCVEIALKCTETDRLKRPKMKEIVLRLNEVETKDSDSWRQIDQSPLNSHGSSSLMITLPKKLSSKYLAAITDGFSVERKLGQGSFGTMYKVTKGILENGMKIVVEKLEENSSVVPDKEFQYEIGNLMALQHENIVKLVGFSYEAEKKVVEHNGVKILADVVESLLCFEYVPNGTLRKYIYGESCQLDWNTRFRIIMGICKGMHFLQQEGGPSVRLELNPSNILLDKNMAPKIAGYGVGRLLNHATQMNRRHIVGASVYKPPEYYNGGSIFLGTDIYYLGILIVEIATGEKYNLGNVYRDWTDEGIEWNYPSLDTTGINQVKACMQIGLTCVEANTRRAPRIEFIVNNLRKTTYLGTMPEKMRSGSISFFRVQPRQLCFPYESRKLTSCSLYLTNSTLFRIVFVLQTENPRRYYTKLPFCGIVPPMCSYTLTVTMREQKKNETFNSDEFLTLQSSIVPGQQLKNVNPDSVAALFEKIRKMAGSSATNKRKIVFEVQEVRIPVVCNPPEGSTSDQSIQSAEAEIMATPNYRQVLSIDVHPAKPWILTTNNRGNVSIWNYHTKATVDSFEVNITEEPVYSGKFIEQKEWVVIGGGDGYIYVYSYESSDTLEEIECFKAHDGHHIMSLAVKPTQSFVLSASDDRLIKLWDWENGWECIQTFQGHYNKVTHVMFDPRDSNRFLSASLDRTVKIWSSDSAKCNITLHGHPDGVICLQYFSSDNRELLIAGSSDGSAKIWDLETESSVGIIEGDGDQLNALFLHPELPVLITGLHNGTVKISKSTSTTAYRLDNIAGFNLGAVNAVGHIKRLRRIVVACGQGLAVLEIKLLLRSDLG